MPNGTTTFLRVRKTKLQKFIMRTKNLDNCAPLGGSENRNKRGGGRPNRKTTVPASFKQGRGRVSKSRGTGGKERSEKTKSRLMRRRFTQKTNKGICFVCFFAFLGKQNKFVYSFFGRIYSTSKLHLVLSDNPSPLR